MRRDASYSHSAEQLSTGSPTLAVLTNDASFKHLPEQLSTGSPTLAAITNDASFEHLPNDVNEFLFKLLSLKEFLHLRAVCQGLRTISFGLGVENSLLCCLSHPVQHAPSFADDINSYGVLRYSWELRQNSDLPAEEVTASALLQMFTVELQSETSQDQVRCISVQSETIQDQVRCIFVHSSDHKRRGQRLLKQDSLPELAPVFSVISQCKNLKSLALTRFNVSVDLMKQLEKLDLQALYLLECSCLENGVEDEYGNTTDLRGFTKLRKLQLTPIRVPLHGIDSYFLPPQLKELELSIPESRADCKIRMGARDCENLERM
jgi:hypothetical protein